MNNRILYQITAPAVVIGLALVAVCIGGALVANRTQHNLRQILTENVSSLESAHEMQIVALRLQFRCYLYLIDPDEWLLDEIQQLDAQFARYLEKARSTAHTEREQHLLDEIQAGFDRFHQEFKRLQTEAWVQAPKRQLTALAEKNPIEYIVEPCEELLLVNKAQMSQTRRDSESMIFWLSVALAVIGLGGPASGLILGMGIAGNLRRSLTRLSVRVHDVVERLETNVGTISVTPDGDLEYLDSQLTHILCRVEEVTQRMQNQAREMLRAQQLSAVGQLAASVAHEVRNPLMPIKMLVEAALRPNQPRPLTEKHLRVILNEVIRVEKTVQTFLDFTRPPVLHRGQHDLRDIIQQALTLVQGRARQQRVEIETDMPWVPCDCQVDREQLATVLINLCLNAFDAMPGGGCLRLRLKSDGDSYRLCVEDTGNGIAPEILDQLFTPFVSGKVTGTGLGLCISRRIIEDHGGQLTGENMPLRGARFTIELPQECREHAETSHH